MLYNSCMKIGIALLLFSFFLLTFSVRNIFAGINVEVSGNGENTSSSVNIENKVNTSVFNNSTSQVKTRIKVTTNNETIEKEFNEPGDITVESSDGTAKVRVNNTVNTTAQTPKSANQQNKTEENKIQEEKAKADEKIKEAKKEVEKKKKEAEEKKSDLRTTIVSGLASLKKFILGIRFNPLSFFLP